MKITPEEKNIQRDMQSGRTSLDGYLGDDKRPYELIIKDDLRTLSDIGITNEEIGKKMRQLTLKAMDGLGDEVIIGDYAVEVEEYMGWIGCPFKDNRKSGKRITTVTNLKTGEMIQWTDMNIHLIKDHGFFQGIGSPFRLEPVNLAKFLNLQPNLKEDDESEDVDLE